MSHELLLKTVDLHNIDSNHFQKQVGDSKKQKRTSLQCPFANFKLMDFWQTRHKSYGETLDKTPITLANSIMIWSWFFSKLLIMKNTYTGYT